VSVIGPALVASPIIGPEPGSVFARIGNPASYGIPLLLIAVTLAGFAIRERSSGFALSAALVLSLAATVADVLAPGPVGFYFDSVFWVHLAQLNAAVLAISALTWIGSVWAWRRRHGELSPVGIDRSLTTLVFTSVVLKVLLLVAAIWSLWLNPRVSAW